MTLSVTLKDAASVFFVASDTLASVVSLEAENIKDAVYTRRQRPRQRSVPHVPHKDAGSVLNQAILCIKIYTMTLAVTLKDAASVRFIEFFRCLERNENDENIRTLPADAAASEAPRLRQRGPP